MLKKIYRFWCEGFIARDLCPEYFNVITGLATNASEGLNYVFKDLKDLAFYLGIYSYVRNCSITWINKVYCLLPPNLSVFF